MLSKDGSDGREYDQVERGTQPIKRKHTNPTKESNNCD